MTSRHVRGHRGFTLLELILALTIGLVVLTTATAVAASTWQSIRGVGIRDNVTRYSRYIAVTLQRDVQETGVDLASSVDFGTLAVWNDTIAILRVPYEPTAPGQYPLSPANFPTGVCGVTCVDIETGGAAPQLAVGDLARIQVSNVRRLIYVTAVNQVNGVYRIDFADTPTLLNHAGGSEVWPSRRRPARSSSGSASWCTGGPTASSSGRPGSTRTSRSGERSSRPGCRR